MSSFARGKHAKAISDRSGMAFPYNEMVKEWNGSLVHISEFEAKQPQLELKADLADGEALMNARTDRTEPSVPVLLDFFNFLSFVSLSDLFVYENLPILSPKSIPNKMIFFAPK